MLFRSAAALRERLETRGARVGSCGTCPSSGHHTEPRQLLREGVECLLGGDLDTGKAILRAYINATIGFDALSEVTNISGKSLMRMFGPKGNPQARNLLEVIVQLQRAERLNLRVFLKSA